MDLTRLPVRVEPGTCMLSDPRLLEQVRLNQSTLSDDGTRLKALTLPFFKRGKAWLMITELIPTAAAWEMNQGFPRVLSVPPPLTCTWGKSRTRD